MLDVHPPHAPTHSWKDFFIHIATICVGLLIAIGLEQSVEAIHRAHQRAEVRQALHNESAQIVYDCSLMDQDIAMKLAWITQVEANVDEALASHHALGSIAPIPSLKNVAGAGNPFYGAARASGRISLLNDQEVVVYGELNEEVQLIDPTIVTVHKGWRAVQKDIRKLSGEKTDAHMSPDATEAQLVEFRSALVEFEDALLAARVPERAARGAGVAISQGELDLKKVEASEMQFEAQP